MTCSHDHFRTLSTAGFTGPVGPGDQQNPAAHGCVTDHDECVRCGARRMRNINQCHEECGMWGPTLDDRRRIARRLDSARRQLVERRPDPQQATHSDGRSIVLSIDSEGYLCARGDAHTDREAESAWLAAWPDGIEIAAAIRRATIDAQEAMADV